MKKDNEKIKENEKIYFFFIYIIIQYERINAR